MRLFPLLTLSIAPCGVLGWYGTQKLMAEPLSPAELDAPTADESESQTPDVSGENEIEPQTMADVQPRSFNHQPKFSALTNTIAPNTSQASPGISPVIDQTLQGDLSLLTVAVSPESISIDRKQVRQVVAQSTQSALAPLSLGPSAAPKGAEDVPEIAIRPEEEIAGIGVSPEVEVDIGSTSTSGNAAEVDSLPIAVAEASVKPEVEPDVKPETTQTSEVAVPDFETAQTVLAEEQQSLVDVEQVVDTPSIEPLEAESVLDAPSTEQLEADLLASAALSTQPNINGAVPLEASATETEIFETEISQDAAVADVSLPVLSPSQDSPAFIAQQVGAPALSPVVNENYILGPGDVIAVDVFNVPAYSGQYSIAADGAITLPQLGRVLVHSMTIQQASDEIAARYAYTLESPLISIQIVQQRPVQVAIAGEIVQPGLYTVSPEGTPYPRLFTALQQAGGLTQAADIKQVEVRRWMADGGQTTLYVDLFALLNQGDISQNIFLQDGDTIMIPSAATVDVEALDQLSDSNLRNNINQPIDVAIVGEVNQPGPYRLGDESGRTTVVQALQQAGGITPSANLRNVQLRRKTRQGDDQFFEVNLWELLQTGDLSQDLVLQQGDTLVIPTAPDVPIPELTAFTASTLSTGTIEVNVLGEVESPGAQQVRANTSLNQAILSAGGLNRRTRGNVTLVRFNPDGTVSQQEIKIDLSQEINGETNPILRPNDVILVGRSAKAAFDDTVRDLSGTFNLLLPLLLLGL